jgi:16S rRNA G1207 methylase RsmC
MNDRDLAHMLLQNHFTAVGALTALQMRHLPDEVRGRVADVISNGTGYIELRTRLDTSQTELVLVPVDGSEALWLAKTKP